MQQQTPIQVPVFQFALGGLVIIGASGEKGRVIGRAEYLDSAPSYYVRYKGADGRAVECWWGQSALEAAD